MKLGDAKKILKENGFKVSENTTDDTNLSFSQYANKRMLNEFTNSTIELWFPGDDNAMMAQDCYTGLTNQTDQPYTDCSFEEHDGIITIVGTEHAIEELLPLIEIAYGRFKWEKVGDSNS